MDSVTVLINRYGLGSLSETSSAGVFAHSELQSRYNTLAETGLRSPENALRAFVRNLEQQGENRMYQLF